MNEKIKIITFAHKRPDFIESQYKSIKKYVKCDYEYVVFNNAVDDEKLKKEIHEICEKINIKCIDVELEEKLRETNGEINFTEKKYTNPNLACSYPLVWLWTEKTFLNQENYLCIIDSDMFFISDINLFDLIKDNDIVYIPQYRANGSVKYIHSHFVCLNLKKNPKLLDLNWNPGKVYGNAVDVGGQNHFFLQKNEHEMKNQYIDEYSIEDIYYSENGDKNIHFIINGNVNYRIILDEKNNLKHCDVFLNRLDKICSNKSFPHEKDFESFYEYSEHLKNIVLSLFGLFETKKINILDFPKPIRIEFLTKSLEHLDFFIVHYKSGSNYLSFNTNEYNKQKTNEIIKFI